jgi:hypothetical protein
VAQAQVTGVLGSNSEFRRWSHDSSCGRRNYASLSSARNDPATLTAAFRKTAPTGNMAPFGVSTGASLSRVAEAAERNDEAGQAMPPLSLKYIPLAYIVLAFGCAASVGGRVAGPAARARLEVYVGDQTIGSGRNRSLRPVEMTLTNASSCVLWVNTLMRVAAPGDFPRRAEIDLEVTAPSGKLVFGCKARSTIATRSAYALLKPGERLTTKAALWCYGPLDEPGTYRAQATYLDGSSEAPPAPDGSEHLSEAVISEPFQFHVGPK